MRRRVLPPPRHGKRKVCNHATKHSFNQTDNLISQGFVEYIELKDGSNRRKDYLEYLTILREQRQMSEERKIAKYIGKWLYWIHIGCYSVPRGLTWYGRYHGHVNNMNHNRKEEEERWTEGCHKNTNKQWKREKKKMSRVETGSMCCAAFMSQSTL